MKENNVKKQDKKKTAKSLLGGRFGLILILIAVVAGIGVFVFLRMASGGSGGSNSSLEIFTVNHGDLIIDVTESGDIKALDSVEIQSQVEGRTTIISIVDEGTYITAEDVNNGKILCELDSSDIKEKLTQQEISFSKVEASFTEARESLDIQKKQHDSDIQAGGLKVKFALMDFKKYLGEVVSQEIIEDINQVSNPSINTALFLGHPKLGGSASQKLKQLGDDINLADSKYKRAMGLLEGSQKLYDANYIAKTELEADQLTVQSLKVQKEQAEVALQLFKLYEFPKEAEQFLSDYYEAKRELERIEARARSKFAQAKADLESKEATYSLQKKRLEKLQKQFDACIMRAPAVGQVVYSSSMMDRWQRRRRLIEIGAEVRQRQKIISIPDLTKMKVEVKIHEMWIDKVQLGQEAEIKIAAFSDEPFTGKIIRKAPLADQTDWWGGDAKVYTTDVGIDGSHDFLKTGMTAEVKIIIDRLKDVLSVPIQAVVNYEGKKVCFVSTGKGARQREVETGAFNNDFVEIKSGLAEGEKVLLNPPRLVESEPAEE